MFQVLIELRHVDVNPARLVKNLNEKSGERQVYLSHGDFRPYIGGAPRVVPSYSIDGLLHRHETWRGGRPDARNE